MSNEELKQQFREAVKLGKSRWQAAQEFGVSPATAFRWMTDLPKRAKADKRLAPEEKERVRALVLSGLSKYQAAKEMGISYPYVLWLTRDIPSSYDGNRCLSQKTLEILRKLFKEGYFMLGELDTTTNHYRTLAKNFSIKKVTFGDKTVIFLEDRKEEALRGFFRHVGNKVVHYNKMKELAGLFGCL